MINNSFRKLLSTQNNVLYFTMSKNKSKKSGLQKNEPQAEKEQPFPITIDKSNFVTVQIHAKPGAKQNAITGISSEGLEVQINAPPTEGAANTELVKYIASVVGVSKGNVIFDRGHKSKNKTLKISDKIDLDTVRKKIMEEIDNK